MSATVAYRKPALYDATNTLILRDAMQSLEKYSHLLRWKERERALDVGCGTGNVTTQVLVPHLPTDYKLLVGLDISEPNVKYAAEHYSGPHITYLHGDIAEPDFQMLKGYFEKENISIGFDKVFSFNCLGWVKNSGQWSKNIYSLLRPGGQTFLMFFTHASFIEMRIETAFSKRWIPYTKAVEPYRNEFHNSTDINDDLTKVMTNAGFIMESCEHYPCYLDNQWPDESVLKLFESGDPYVHTIPEELHSAYFEDFFSVYKKYKSKYSETGLPYTIAVIVASKPGN